MPENNELVLKPISELLEESFFIPAYQRGYRWTKRQVIELLDDIREFQQQSEEGLKSAFYCLQPIVVKKRNSEWELVDGQQRLTTIHIILGCFKEITALLDKPRFKMRYETRHNSAVFLENIDDSLRDENIDFFHICQAKDAILEWFDSQDGAYKIKFLQTLLSGDEVGKNVKVIWYQINEEVDVTTVFTRLNIGKIPLTNAELVKALFLKSSNFNEPDRHLHQLKIAHEWDDIERMLQNDEFWFFISNKHLESNRIEFILGLVAKSLLGSSSIIQRDPLYVFLTFNLHLSSSEELIDDEWDRVKRCFMTLKEWFEDRLFFHLVGYLISLKETVSSILKTFSECETKNDFRRKLINTAFIKAIPDSDNLDSYQDRDSLREVIEAQMEQLSYYSPRPKLIAILSLFNVASLLANPSTNARFQFNRFKLEEWDIEHIRSVASHMPESKERQRLWLEGVVDYISDAALSVEIESVLKRSQASQIRVDAERILQEKTFDSDAFEEVFSQVLELYNPEGDEEADNSIGNLTLLDRSTNRSYQNAIFPIKRKRIIELDKTATFVPLCTKNVFLKYYSKQLDNMMFWDARDSEDHKLAMVEMLTSFFTATGGAR